LAGQVAFLDTSLSPDTAYEYRVAVVNASGHAELSNRETVAGYTVKAVRLLAAESDPAAGAIRLRWNRYRDPGFAAYEVVRRQVGTGLDTVLFLGHNVADTVYIDATVLHDVPYTYAVRATAAGQVLPSNSADGFLILPGVTIAETRFTSSTASCSLVWSPYQGPRFARYQIVRLQEGVGPTVVGEIASDAATTFTDTGLHGNTVYSYLVTVLTVAGEEISGHRRGGSFHELADTWPMDLSEGVVVRLSARTAGRIEALVSSENDVRLQVYDPMGQLLREEVLYANPHLPNLLPPRIIPQCVSTTLGQDEQRFLVLGHTDRLLVVALSQEGEPTTRDIGLFSQQLPEGLLLSGRVTLHIETALGVVSNQSEVGFDNVTVSVAGHAVVEEGFEDGLPSDWEFDFIDAPIVGTYPRVSMGALTFRASALSEGARAHRGDASWREPRLEADVWMSKGAAGMVSLGAFPGDYIRLRLRERSGEALLDVRKKATSMTRSRVSVDLWPWMRYRVVLQAQDEQVIAWLRRPFLWIEEWDGMPVWASTAAVEDVVAISLDEERLAVSGAGEIQQPERVPSATSDMRVWGSGRDARMALCLPDENRIVVGRPSVSSFSGRLTYPREEALTTVVLGAGAGHEDGALLFPLSVDRGPDGRHYVVDAGNSRIQASDADGGYLTQWGTRGGGEGQFQFGRGIVSTDFAGSICVDHEGYIYVADVYNQRIQKFAP